MVDPLREAWDEYERTVDLGPVLKILSIILSISAESGIIVHTSGMPFPH
jgi:hypothetical protein